MMIPIELIVVFVTAFIGFVGFIAYQVWQIKTNDLWHLEHNLKKLMTHFDVKWDD